MKIFNRIVLSILFFMIGLSVYFHVGTKSWPISRTKAFNVRVIDENGKPVPGAIVKIEWGNKTLALHSMGTDYKKAFLVSNESGFVHVPSMFNIHIYSYFDNMRVQAFHPLQASGGLIYWAYKDPRYQGFGRDNAKEWGMDPVPLVMPSLDSLYQNSSCILIEQKTFGFKENCSGKGESGSVLHGHILETIQNYYWILDVIKISEPNMKFLFPKEKAISKWKGLASKIYAKSVVKPMWPDRLKNEIERKPL